MSSASTTPAPGYLTATRTSSRALGGSAFHAGGNRSWRDGACRPHDRGVIQPLPDAAPDFDLDQRALFVLPDPKAGLWQMDSTQKVAVITGASQGIGAGLVDAYRKLGYAVVATSRSIDTVRRPRGADRRRATSPTRHRRARRSSRR